jgi:hypothetical protein
MNLSPGLTRYLVWAGVTAIGVLLAVFDRRWIGRPLFGVLLVAGVISGVIITRVSPFTFSGGDHFIEGLLLAAGSALALIGYVLAFVWQFARRLMSQRSRR